MVIIFCVFRPTLLGVPFEYKPKKSGGGGVGSPPTTSPLTVPGTVTKQGLSTLHYCRGRQSTVLSVSLAQQHTALYWYMAWCDALFHQLLWIAERWTLGIHYNVTPPPPPHTHTHTALYWCMACHDVLFNQILWTAERWTLIKHSLQCTPPPPALYWCMACMM